MNDGLSPSNDVTKTPGQKRQEAEFWPGLFLRYTTYLSSTVILTAWSFRIAPMIYSLQLARFFLSGEMCPILWAAMPHLIAYGLEVLFA